MDTNQEQKANIDQEERKCMCCGSPSELIINSFPVCKWCMLDGSAVQLVYQMEGAR